MENREQTSTAIASTRLDNLYNVTITAQHNTRFKHTLGYTCHLFVLSCETHHEVDVLHCRSGNGDATRRNPVHPGRGRNGHGNPQVVVSVTLEVSVLSSLTGTYL